MSKSESELDDFGKNTLKHLRATPPIDPQVFADEKVKFLLHGEALRQVMQTGVQDVQIKGTARKTPILGRIFSIPLYKALAVIILVLVLIGGSSLSVFAAQHSLPGEPLYNLKAASEDVRLSLTFSTQEKLNLTLDYTNRRMNEIQSLLMEGKSLPDQSSTRYQSELEAALELAAQLDDQQLESALNKIKKQAERQGITVEQLIARLPDQASPAMIRLLERLSEQVEISSIGEKNPQAFRLQVHERLQNRHGPKHSPTSEQPGVLPIENTKIPSTPSDHNPGKEKSTSVPDQGNPGKGNGQNNPGNGNHDMQATSTP